MQILQNLGEILGFLQNFPEFSIFSEIFCKILKIQLAHFVDLEKCCKMSIWLQKSVLMQPRTGLGKSDVSWHGPALGGRPAARPRPCASRLRPSMSWTCHASVAPSVGSRLSAGERAGSTCHDTSLFPRPVLGCINTDFCNQILILQHFSRSTE